MASVTWPVISSWKDPVANAAALPATGNTDGDARVDVSTDTIYIWHDAGSNWLAVATPGAAIALDGLNGDVSASGPGVVSATVNAVGGSSAANIHTSQLATAAATDANTASTIVKRDSSGNFSATTITANLTGNASGTSANVTGSSNSTLTTLSSLSLPGSQVTGNISGNSANVTGVVALTNGGTGQTTALAAIDALLPSQTSNSGKFLTTDGTDPSWATVSAGGSPGGSDGQFQYNDSGSFNGSSAVTFSERSLLVGASNTVVGGAAFNLESGYQNNITNANAGFLSLLGYGLTSNSANFGHVYLGTFNAVDGTDPIVNIGCGTADGSRANAFAVNIDGSSTFYGNQIHLVADPTSAQDVATKNYVDTNAGGLPAPLEALATYTDNVLGFTGTFIGNDSDADQSNLLIQIGSTDTSNASHGTSELLLFTGDITAASSSKTPGDLNINAGNVTDPTSSGHGAGVFITAGSGTIGSGGGIVFNSGSSTSSTGGDLNFTAGNGTGSNSGGIIFNTSGTATTQINSKLVLSQTAQTLTTGGTILATTSFNALQAASAIPTSSSTVITAGVVNGQTLQITNIGSNTITLKAGGNTALPNAIDYALTAKSSISFIWNTATWYTTSASGN